MMPSPPSERERAAYADILAKAALAERFVAEMTFAAFEADERTHLAVVRCLEIVSEASRRLSDETKARHPVVPWRQVADAGNAYRHGYDGLTLDIIWLTVHHEPPVLVAAIRAEQDRASDS